MGGEILTIEEVAAMLHKEVGTLRNWRTPGRRYGPPSFNAGGTVLYRRSAVEAWIAGQEQARAAEGAAPRPAG